MLRDEKHRNYPFLKGVVSVFFCLLKRNCFTGLKTSLLKQFTGKSKIYHASSKLFIGGIALMKATKNFRLEKAAAEGATA